MSAIGGVSGGTDIAVLSDEEKSDEDEAEEEEDSLEAEVPVTPTALTSLPTSGKHEGAEEALLSGK
jgi:hypothetical protein